MDTSKHHNKREIVSDKEDGQSPKHQNPTSPTIISLPRSSSSSPSHDFSFTISLQPSSATRSPDKFKHPPSVAIDLSPADDIFFHGHLLPLQLVTCSRISPRRRRSSSSDNINRPSCRHNHDQMLKKNYSNGSTSNKGNTNTAAAGAKERSRPKSFMFRLAKLRKALENGETDDDIKEKKTKKKKEKFEVGRFLKRYMKLISPLFFRSWGKKEKRNIQQQPYSMSGHLNSRLKERGGRRGGGFSAPASMGTSPTNSGLLLATAMASPSDSTMEDLQNAIQAAIAHCKSSISAKEDKCKC